MSRAPWRHSADARARVLAMQGRLQQRHERRTQAAAGRSPAPKRPNALPSEKRAGCEFLARNSRYRPLKQEVLIMDVATSYCSLLDDCVAFKVQE